MSLYEKAEQEPLFSDVVNDPIVKMLMHYDGIRPEDFDVMAAKIAWESKEAA